MKKKNGFYHLVKNSLKTSFLISLLFQHLKNIATLTKHPLQQGITTELSSSTLNLRDLWICSKYKSSELVSKLAQRSK